MSTHHFYGLLADFHSSKDLIAAAQQTKEAGYTHWEAYTPYPIEELYEIKEKISDPVAFYALIGGLLGGVTGYVMQWFANVIHYPLNVGGRPDYSWPSFIPITFELTILGSAIFTVSSMILSNRLPQLYHPVFHGETFTRASRDGFFLCIESKDPLFHLVRTSQFLNSLHAVSVQRLPILEGAAL